MGVIYLSDIVFRLGGPRKNPHAVSLVLEIADAVLPGGRDCTRPLTPRQVRDLHAAAKYAREQARGQRTPLHPDVA